MFDRAPVGVGPRAAAFVIDVAVLALIIVVVWTLAGGVNQGAENDSSFTDPNTGASLVIAFALLVYFGGLESAWGGSTVGKRLIGLRVAMLDGSPLSGRAVFMRTVGRFFDCSLFSPIVAAVCVLQPRSAGRTGRCSH